MRRIVAGVVIAVLLILIILGIHSCQQSAKLSGLKDYNNSVASLIQQSDSTGKTVFKLLTGASSASVTSLTNSLNQAKGTADAQLSHAKSLSVPDEMKAAHADVVLALTMRRDGIADIAANIQQALGASTNKDAVTTIAAEMALFYASDAVYKDYATHFIAGALESAGIAVGGANGQIIDYGQFLPDIQWLQPKYVAQQLRVRLSGKTGPISPGTHGHILNSVSVSGTTLQTGSTNTIAASPAPSFTLNFTNSGTNNESNVVCKVTVTGTNVSGTTTIAQTTAGQTTTCTVPLGTTPPTGNQTVTATVEPVPGEIHTANNTQSFPVTFQ